MKKMILFTLALMMTGSMQAQEVISLPQPEVNKLSHQHATCENLCLLTGWRLPL